jgi:hypothetical protein
MSSSRRTRRLQKAEQSIAKRSPKKPVAATVTSSLATMSDSSSLASVVHVESRKWEKLADDYPLAVFHRRFWGKSMKDEEEEWQKTQPQTESQSKDEDEDRYEGKAIDDDDNETMEVEEYEGKGKDKAIDEDEGEVEEDQLEDEATDEDEDDIPGCYPFSVGFEDITVWIRADYIRVYEALEDYYEKAMKRSGRTPSAVITGQPGIGESHYSLPLCSSTQNLALRQEFLGILCRSSPPR